MPVDEGLREPEKHQGLQRRGLDTQTCRRGARVLETELSPDGV